MSINHDIVEGGRTFLLEGSEVGVLLSHGFTGTTSSMRPLGEFLHRTEGWTVLAPCLKGHGDTPQAMATTGAQDWIRSVEDALGTLQSRCQHVFMAGLSMGGTLTLYMAARYPAAFRAIAPINAALELNAPGLASLAYASDAPFALTGVGNDLKDPDVTELAYRELPVRCLRELYALTAVTRDMLPLVTAPALVLVSPDDHVVPPSNSHLALQALGSTQREMLVLRNSFHVATIDFDKDIIHEAVRRFFRQQLPA